MGQQQTPIPLALKPSLTFTGVKDQDTVVVYAKKRIKLCAALRKKENEMLTNDGSEPMSNRDENTLFEFFTNGVLDPRTHT